MNNNQNINQINMINNQDINHINMNNNQDINIDTKLDIETKQIIDSTYKNFTNDIYQYEYLYSNNLYSNNESTNNFQFDKDPWDDSINDNKFIINNKIIRIFPQLKNSNNYLKLKIDEESLSFITIREIADLTSKIICHHLIKYNLNPQKIKIIDYTAGVGGNVLSFCKYFNYVYAIELEKTRYEYLLNNINIYGFKNINCINDSAINFIDTMLIDINPNVIFIDPPWGGSEYKNTDLLKLKLGNKPIEELIIDIFKKIANDKKNKINQLEYSTEIISNNKIKKTYEYNNYDNKIIVLKLPKNYDIEYLYQYIKANNYIENYTICTYLYILNKMLIVVCEFCNFNN